MKWLLSLSTVQRAQRARLGLLSCGGLLVVLLLVAWASPASGHAGPFVPSGPDVVLERLPTRLRGSHPGANALVLDPEQSARAAEAELRLYQRTSDPRYLGRAEAKLGAFWDAPSPPVVITVLRAKIRASNHDFAPALADLSSALSRDAENAQARFERAGIETVRGDYAAARADCEGLSASIPAIYRLGCAAAVRGATGEARPAALELERALAENRAAADAFAWAASLTGELWARAGEPSRAELWLRRALADAPGDSYTLATLSDVLLDDHRAGAARDLLADQTRLDALLLRLAIAEHQLGAPAATEHIDMLAERFADAALRGSAVHRREEARFELLRGNARRALELALANFQVQREAWDVRLVLEAADAAGEPERAREAAEFASRSGLTDPGIKRLLSRLSEARP